MSRENIKSNLKPKWDWMQVDCNLKTEVNRKYMVWSLAPSIVLTNPLGEGPDPSVKLYVDTEKSLQFSEDLGWNWHKSWNLPNISIRVEAQLFAVKVVVDPHEKNENAHLVDVGIRGTSKIEMVDGQAYFTAMKFLSTSYNNEGVKFYLLLVLYINNNDAEPPKILTATLSPPIFVDSRKSARDNQEKKYSSFIQPFLVENLEKEFIKRENKRKNETEIKIKNDFEGLFSYLTAPNIRHKVKHPMFISIKFSLCAKLFYNTNLISKDTPINELLNILQKKISKDHTSRRSSKVQTKIDDKMFILLINDSYDSYKNKKVQESIDPLDCNSLGIIYNAEQLPPFFQNAATLGNLANAYKEQYSQLYLTAKSIMNTDNSDDGSDDDDSRSEPNSDDDDESPMGRKVSNNGYRGKNNYSDDDDESQDNRQSSSRGPPQHYQQDIIKRQAPSFAKQQQPDQNSSESPKNYNGTVKQQPSNPLSTQQVPQSAPQQSHPSLNHLMTPNPQAPNLPHQNHTQNPQQPGSGVNTSPFDQILNNMFMNNPFNPMKMGNTGLFGTAGANPSILNSLLGANKGLSLPGMMPQSQNNDLLASLLVGGLGSPLGVLGLGMAGLGGLPSNLANNPTMNAAAAQQNQNSSTASSQQQQKVGFSPTMPSNTPSLPGMSGGLPNQPNSLMLFQQLALYRDLINQINSPIGGINLASLLAGGAGLQGLGQSQLSQLGQNLNPASLTENLSRSLGAGLGGQLNPGAPAPPAGMGFMNNFFGQNPSSQQTAQQPQPQQMLNQDNKSKQIYEMMKMMQMSQQPQNVNQMQQQQMDMHQQIQNMQQMQQHHQFQQALQQQLHSTMSMGNNVNMGDMSSNNGHNNGHLPDNQPKQEDH